jgi:hypothetical protein
MSSLIDQVLGSLDGNTINQIAAQLGTSPRHAEGAIQAALPLLIGAMGRNSAQPEGAQSLHRAIERDHANVDLGSVLGGLLGGSGVQGGLGQGGAILGHIFGGRQQRAATGLGKMAGLESADAAKLMAMLAPILMGVLGQQTTRGGLDPNALGGLLGQETQRVTQGLGGGLLGAVLDRDGDGDVDFQDLMQAGGGLLGNLLGGNSPR